TGPCACPKFIRKNISHKSTKKDRKRFSRKERSGRRERKIDNNVGADSKSALFKYTNIKYYNRKLMKYAA
ncbi:hypothetical protein KAJ27_08335, partial [bacterium]|nr:hypothetical protein [bacterium]